MLIIRNPKDAILSDFSLSLKHSHTSEIYKYNLEGKRWENSQWRNSGFQKWHKVYKTAVKRCNNIQIIRYEFIKESLDNVISEMHQVSVFLNQHNPNFKTPFRQKCLEASSEGNFKRKHHKKLDMADFISLEEKIEPNKYILSLQKYLKSSFSSLDFNFMDEYLFLLVLHQSTIDI